jgi:putative flavoprotein involved in K+ transport
MERQQAAAFAEIRKRDALFYERLEKTGFLLSYGKDGSGLLPQLFARGSGYCIDVGASELMIDGSIKVHR